LRALQWLSVYKVQYLAAALALERVRAHFGKPFNDAWTIQKPKDDVHQLLLAVMLLSSGVVTWLVLVKA